MGALIDYIAHPPEVLASLERAAPRSCWPRCGRSDVERATRVVTEHLEGTVHVLAGLLPLRAGAGV